MTAEPTNREPTTRLLRDIAETARTHRNEWDVAKLAEVLELYGVYLRGHDGASGPPLGFVDFAADDVLIGRMRATRDVTR